MSDAGTGFGDRSDLYPAGAKVAWPGPVGTGS